MLDRLDATAARRWGVGVLGALRRERVRLDEMNVFPVPDGDTGTNLLLTVEHALGAVAQRVQSARVTSLGELADTFARGALMGARGNSGVILAQLLRGWADVIAEVEAADGPTVRKALRRADEQAWAAVGEPREGTILSVTRGAALAADEAGDSLLEVTRAAVDGARLALAATTGQLEVLARAGVVDAGGAGFLLFLEELAAVVSGEPVEQRASDPALVAAVPELGADLDRSGPAYEVIYLLDADDADVPALRTRLAQLGDSLVVVGGAGLWHVHVHVDDPGAALEAGIGVGRPHQMRVTHFAEQVSRRERGRRTTGQVGVVAVAAGDGLERLFAQSGAVVVRARSRRASTGELLDAVRSTGAQAVVLLPNDADTIAAAEAAAAAARDEGIRTTVLTTRAQVQGLAALAVLDTSRPADDVVSDMSAAAAATRHGGVTVAVRDGLTSGGPCRVGDVLGVLDGDIALVGDDLLGVSGIVVERLLSSGGELVTLVTGMDADAGLATAVARLVRRSRPDVEVHVVDGGQPRYPLLVGVE